MAQESLRYTLAREQRLEKITHVRRNLFGPTDNEQLQQDFQDMLCDSMKEAQQKWSFDFLQDAPVEGVVQWEKLDENEVPAFYHSCVVRRAQRPLQLLNHQSHHPAQVALSEKPKKTENNRVSEGKKIKQTSLTGYYSAMKKVKKNMKATAKMSTLGSMESEVRPDQLNDLDEKLLASKNTDLTCIEKDWTVESFC